AHNQHRTLSAAHCLEQPIQRLALLAPAVQHLRRPLGDHATSTIPRPAAVDTPRDYEVCRRGLRGASSRTTRSRDSSEPTAHLRSRRQRQPPTEKPCRTSTSARTICRPSTSTITTRPRLSVGRLARTSRFASTGPNVSSIW